MNIVTVRNSEIIPLKNLASDVEFITFHGIVDGKEHIALRFTGWDKTSVPIIRIHSECMTGDVFHSLRCDCGEQLDEALSIMDKQGGIVIYLRQEGRGIGLYNKIDAYKLQSSGIDTYQANITLGFPKDNRDFMVAAQILKALNIESIRLLSNNPEKKNQLEHYGISVTEQISTSTFVNKFNQDYLQAKKNKTNHSLKL